MDTFPWTDLIDDLRPHVLKHLTVKELVAIERVDSKMFADVKLAMSHVKKLVIVDKKGRLLDGFCRIQEHQFDERDIVKITTESHASLIKKLPHLVAIVIYPEVSPGAIDALSKCSQLRHVDITNDEELDLPLNDCSKIECSSVGVSKLDPAKFPNLKYFSGILSPSNLETLLKNGLERVTSYSVSSNCRRIIIERGQNLQIINVTFANLGHEELVRIGQHFKTLLVEFLYANEDYFASSL